MPKVMNRNALAQISCGQKFPAFVDLQFRPEVVKASGASINGNEVYQFKNMTEKELLLLIGKNIERLRAVKNIRQYQLAATCGSEKASFSRIESGKTNTTILTLLKISKALDVPMSQLLMSNHSD